MTGKIAGNEMKVLHRILHKAKWLTGDKGHTSSQVIFSTGSRNEIFEFIRTQVLSEVADPIWRSKGLCLLNTVVAVLVHLRDKQHIKIDYELIVQTMEISNLKKLTYMDIPGGLRYDIEYYISKLPFENKDVTHDFILIQFSNNK